VSEPSRRATVVRPPTGVYARCVRPLCEAVLVLAVLPFALALALPIALVNLVVFKDPRKILFRQERVGLGGRVFRINKFRTMRDASTSTFQSWGDAGDAARVTRFGRFLRNSHLDELPQLVNVVCGDMSLIGPRPEMVEIEAWANREVPGFSSRLAVRPGITGWAQITQGYVGRCGDGYARKFALGLEYLERFGPRQDFEILLRTALWMLRRKGWRWQEQRAANGAHAPAEEPAGATEASAPDEQRAAA
jgi:lipopolysaccharide/colanic/teichoic acid biosynthesis glycosyltransferase